MALTHLLVYREDYYLVRGRQPDDVHRALLESWFVWVPRNSAYRFKEMPTVMLDMAITKRMKKSNIKVEFPMDALEYTVYRTPKYIRTVGDIPSKVKPRLTQLMFRYVPRPGCFTWRGGLDEDKLLAEARGVNLSLTIEDYVAPPVQPKKTKKAKKAARAQLVDRKPESPPADEERLAHIEARLSLLEGSPDLSDDDGRGNLYKRGPRWYVRFRHKGKEIRRVGGSKADARVLLERLRAKANQAEDPLHKLNTDVESVNDRLTKWMDGLAPRLDRLEPRINEISDRVAALEAQPSRDDILEIVAEAVEAMCEPPLPTPPPSIWQRAAVWPRAVAVGVRTAWRSYKGVTNEG